MYEVEIEVTETFKVTVDTNDLDKALADAKSLVDASLVDATSGKVALVERTQRVADFREL